MRQKCVKYLCKEAASGVPENETEGRKTGLLNVPNVHFATITVEQLSCALFF